MNIDFCKLVNHYEFVLNEENYYNVEKLKILFSFWLKIYKYSLDKNIQIPHNCLNIFEEVFRQEVANLRIKKKKQKLSFTKKIIVHFLSKIPLKTGILQVGLLSRAEKLRAQITYSKLYCRANEINNCLHQKFLKPFEGNANYSSLLQKLPLSFFLQDVRSYGFPNLLKASPVCLYNSIFIKSLFCRKKIFLNGYQHGGGYGEIIDNQLTLFDQDISNCYYFWGLGSKNIIQNRFIEKPVISKKVNNIYIVGTQDFDGIFSYLTKFDAGNYTSTLKIRHKLINHLQNKHFNIKYLESPKSSSNDFINYPTTKLSRLSNAEKEVGIFILDYPMHTFFYEAIYSSIPFILFFNSDWNIKFTKKYSDLLKFLRQNNLLYFWNEIDLISKNLSDCINNMYPFHMITKIREYLKNP